MTARDPFSDKELVPGRACGPCTVCCVALTIDDPELHKPQGYRCPHVVAHKGCGIYETRPETCRTFFCGWRRLKWVRETLRPDKSGVLVRLHYEVSKERGTHLGVTFTLLNDAAVKAEGLAETVAAAVAADVPVFLYIPGPPGYTGAQTRINEALANAVITKDKPAILQILRQARAKARSGKFVPVSQAGRRGEMPV